MSSVASIIVNNCIPIDTAVYMAHYDKRTSSHCIQKKYNDLRRKKNVY